MAAGLSDAARIEADLSHYAMVLVRGSGDRVSVLAKTIRPAWNAAANLHKAHGNSAIAPASMRC
jgi:hypothetical protein